jgi:hypothetical protein
VGWDSELLDRSDLYSIRSRFPGMVALFEKARFLSENCDVSR